MAERDRSLIFSFNAVGAVSWICGRRVAEEERLDGVADQAELRLERSVRVGVAGLHLAGVVVSGCGGGRARARGKD